MSLWTNPVNVIAGWLTNLLTGWGLPGWLASLLIQFIGVVVLVSIMMIVDIGLVWIERKVVARFQDRLGPNRVGPFGIIQPFADIIKLLIKEDITPVGADRVVYNLAPIMMLMSVLLLWAIVPLAPAILGVDLNVGALYIIAVGAIGTLAIIMAAWASNNKYALIGAFRQVAVLVSFEVPMIATMLIPTVLAGSMGMTAIIQAQNIPYFLLAPLAAIVFIVAAIAELGRSPFDLNEAESEIVAGFHIEYTGMKFGLFYAAELLHAFTFGGFWAILFFGGYRLFGLENLGPLVAAAILIAKAMVGYWFIMWVRYTVMRIRIDHMLAFN
jgi:NADH-quinone oxidoreductase subunit H